MENNEAPARQKASLIAILLIIVNDAIQKVVTRGVVSVMVMYLTEGCNMTPIKATNVVFFWEAATSAISFLGGFVSDSYLGRFLYIGFGSLSTTLGIFLLWLTTIIPKSESCGDCGPLTQCCSSSPTTLGLAFLFSSFVLITVGSGGVNCSVAFAIDQLGISQQQRALARFFMFYYASSSVLVVISYIEATNVVDEFGWKKSFGVPVIPLFLFAILFLLASPFYSKEKPKEKNLVTSFVQVIVAACKKRNLSFPVSNSSECYLPEKDSEIAMPSDKLRFLNKACMVSDRDEEIAPDGSTLNPWRLCTIVQVEELKALLKVLPVWSTGIILWVNASHTKFMLLQASSMDRHLSQNFEIPTAVFASFSAVIMFIWIVLYNTVILPLASKIKGEPVQLDVMARMGIGLFLSYLAMEFSVGVESLRRGKVLQEGNSMGMSAMWLLPQCCLIGLGEAFTAIGHVEFFYTEFPRTMSSIAVSLLGLETTVADWLSGVVVTTVSNLTSMERKEMTWNDMNQAPLKYYYQILAAMSYINTLYFFFCGWKYGPCEQPSEEN
ncbi:hypothetical protein SLA2020_386780 [Shorea laevis]